MNAKELILAKINATTKFADIYTYLICTGESFKNIADMMISPIFNVVAKYANDNIFDETTYTARIEDVIGFILDKNTLPIINNYAFNRIILYVPQNINERSSANSLLVKLLRDTYDGSYSFIEEFQEIFEGAEVTSILTNAKQWNQTQKEQIITLFYKYFKENEAFQEKVLNHFKLAIENATDKPSTHQVEDPNEIDLDYIFDEIDDYDHELSATLSDVTWNISEITKSQYRKIYFYLKNFLIPKNKDISHLDIEILKTVQDKILVGAKELNLLGQWLQVNQGMKTNNYDLYSWMTGLETSINRMYRDAGKATTNIPFNFMQFMTNSKFREKQVEQFEEIKKTFNVLKVIQTVPNFFEMLQAVATAQKAIESSVAVRLERALAKSVFAFNEKTIVDPDSKIGLTIRSQHTQKLNKNEFNELQRFVNDVLIFNWASQINRKLVLLSGNSQFTGDKEYAVNGILNDVIKNKPVSLNTTDGLATFKRWFENTFIPILKENYMEWTGSKNDFIDALTTSIQKNKKTNTIMQFVKLPIPLNQIEGNVKLQSMYDKYLTSFNAIKDLSFPYNFYKSRGILKYENSDLMQQWTIGDLFFFYNMIVSKGSVSNNSFSKLFNDSNLQQPFSLVRSWQDYLQQLDTGKLSQQGLKLDVADLLFRLSDKDTDYKFGVSNRYDKFGQLVSVVFKNKDTYDEIEKPIPAKEYWSDYTFNLLSVSNKHTSPIRSDFFEKYDKTRQMQLNNTEVVNAIIDAVTQLTLPTTVMKVQTINNNIINQWLDNGQIDNTTASRLQNSHAFIHNNTVYINLDKPSLTASFHEMLHVLFAGMKFNKDDSVRTSYYDILLNIKNNPAYKEKKAEIQEEYSDLQGSDLEEEVLVHLMEDIFKDTLSTKWQELTETPTFENFQDKITQIFVDIFGVEVGFDDIKKLSGTSLENILTFLNSKMLVLDRTGWITETTVPTSQRIAAIKTKLAKAGNLTIKNC